MIGLRSFLVVKVFVFFNYKEFCYFPETKIRLLYLIHMVFDGRNTGMMFVLFYDCVKEFVSDVVTSLTLYASIPRSGTMLTKKVLKVLAGVFSDVITVEITIRETMFHSQGSQVRTLQPF